MLNNINKVQLDNYFNELAKIYKKRSHGYQFEFIIVGGASILINYDFRAVTNDIDAYYIHSADIKDSIAKISQKFNISPNWLNDDFKTTKSFSNKLSEFSTYYKTYQNILIVRTIKDEYLIAMKLVSARTYKNDISDVVGIINSIRKNGNDITLDIIMKAVKDLYGNSEMISNEIKLTLEKILNDKNLEKLYQDITEQENKDRQKILASKQTEDKNTNEASINDILKILKNIN